MSTSIENLRRLSEREVKIHTALFDLYVTVGRDIEYLSIKFGISPDELINLLEGYGEKPVEEPSGRGRLKNLSRLLVEEYVEQFYPGIASENPENDWINLESYLDIKHPGWRANIVQKKTEDEQPEGKKKVRNKFRLY